MSDFAANRFEDHLAFISEKLTSMARRIDHTRHTYRFSSTPRADTAREVLDILVGGMMNMHLGDLAVKAAAADVEKMRSEK